MRCVLFDGCVYMVCTCAGAGLCLDVGVTSMMCGTVVLQAFKRIAGWNAAVTKARKALGIKGFQVRTFSCRPPESQLANNMAVPLHCVCCGGHIFYIWSPTYITANDTHRTCISACICCV